MRLGCLLVGWRAPDPVAPGWFFVRIRPGELKSAVLTRWGVVVLGDAAMTRLSPAQVHALLHRRRMLCVLCPHCCTGRAVAPWTREGFCRLVFPEELPDVLDELRAESLRRVLRPPDWLPVSPKPDSDEARALQAVPDLARAYSVRDWARELDWSRSKLWRVCISSFKAAPRDVLWRYVEAVVSWGREEGMSMEELAALLGYSNARALVHALERRRGTAARRRRRRDATAARRDRTTDTESGS